MDPEREAVAGAADRREHPRQLITAVTRDVQDWSELLGPELIEAFELEQVGWEEIASGGEPWVELAGVEQPCLATHALDVPPQARPRCFADHRADIRRQLCRWADLELPHGADQHLDDAVGDLFLQVQHAQR